MPHLSYIWMTTKCSFYYIYICFMGVDYTHMRSFVIDNSWSYEIILRVWICRLGIPFCRMVFTVTPHELHGVTNQRPIYCLFNSMHWLTTKEKSKLSYLKRNLYNKLFPNLSDYPFRCVGLPFEKSCFTAMSLQWRHMSVMASHITDRVTICLTACPGWEQKKI